MEFEALGVVHPGAELTAEHLALAVAQPAVEVIPSVLRYNINRVCVTPPPPLRARQILRRVHRSAHLVFAVTVDGPGLLLPLDGAGGGVRGRVSVGGMDCGAPDREPPRRKEANAKDQKGCSETTSAPTVNKWNTTSGARVPGGPVNGDLCKRSVVIVSFEFATRSTSREFKSPPSALSATKRGEMAAAEQIVAALRPCEEGVTREPLRATRGTTDSRRITGHTEDLDPRPWRPASKRCVEAADNAVDINRGPCSKDVSFIHEPREENPPKDPLTGHTLDRFVAPAAALVSS
ncbi:hypothetical protein EYF80_048941 [Liparis tanakae]|uniref:Uncharacterized protein n=1 Tax=Liparis tanakae TaxID=230148 RepID=A0A4Z2FI38_9TELE|nr:hypothetical protein EYF80_048941 [Liparis tanakae]